MSTANKIKFADCNIYYKSGDGESFITEVYNTQKEEMSVDDDETYELESEYFDIINKHNHDDKESNGVIFIRKNKIDSEKYF